MRWRVNDIQADTRKTARRAAKAAGLPLGPWLSRAILAQPGMSPVDAPNSAAPDASADRTDEPAIAMTAKPRPVLRRRTLGAASTALCAAAIIAGAIWLWPMPSTPPETQQAATGQPTDAPLTPSPPPTPTGPPAPIPAPSAAEIAEDLHRAAANGDAMAQHDLAVAYVNGRGVPQNYQIAAAWFEKAAQAGLERAQFNLAVLYENALGVPQDLTRAFTLYSAAAEQGFAPAQHNVAVAYAEGRGTARDYRAAALWFRRAADQGVAAAQFNLGMIHEMGLAGPPDEQTAYGWYRRAAAGGSESALTRLAVIEGRIAGEPSDGQSGAAMPAAKPTTADVAEIQRLLAQLSFSSGPADGKVGTATRHAIRQYQQIAGLPATGEPSSALLRHLRQVTTMMGTGGR